MSRRPFALTEVCVALIIVGICISYIFTSIHHTIQKYASLYQEITCHELADEHLAQLIGTFLTSPLEYNAVVEGCETTLIEGIYEIHLSTSSDEEGDGTDEQETVTKKKASLITLTVAVHPIGNEQIYAIRTTSLCVGLEGTI